MTDRLQQIQNDLDEVLRRQTIPREHRPAPTLPQRMLPEPTRWTGCGDAHLTAKVRGEEPKERARRLWKEGTEASRKSLLRFNASHAATRAKRKGGCIDVASDYLERHGKS